MGDRKDKLSVSLKNTDSEFITTGKKSDKKSKKEELKKSELFKKVHLQMKKYAAIKTMKISPTDPYFDPSTVTKTFS